MIEIDQSMNGMLKTTDSLILPINHLYSKMKEILLFAIVLVVSGCSTSNKEMKERAVNPIEDLSALEIDLVQKIDSISKISAVDSSRLKEFLGEIDTVRKNIRNYWYDQVMDVHDEVMPEMGNLRSLTKRLKGTLDSLQTDSQSTDTVEVIKVNQLIGDLNQASESMMQWMREFEPLEEGSSHGEVMQFLLEEKKKIDQVKKEMLEAKDRAEDYFMQ